MSLAYGKYYSHETMEALLHNSNNKSGYIYAISVPRKVFFAYMGDLGEDDFYKIIPKDIAAIYSYFNNKSEKECFNFKDFKNIRDLWKKEENFCNIVKMNIYEFRIYYQKYKLKFNFNHEYTLFDISSELINLSQEKQMYLLNENYEIVKNYKDNNITPHGSSALFPSLNKKQEFILNYYMPSKHYSFHKYLENMGFEKMVFDLHNTFLNRSNYSIGTHDEIVNAIFELKRMSNNKDHSYEKKLLQFLKEGSENGNSLFHDQNSYENILLDYLKKSIENGDLTKEDVKKLDLELYNKCNLFMLDSTELISSVLIRKDFRLNLKNLGDEQFKMALMAAMEYWGIDQIVTVFKSYLEHHFDTGEYQFKVKLEINAITVEVISFEKEFDENKKLMKALLLAIDFISSNTLSEEERFEINLEQLLPSLRELSLSEKIDTNDKKIEFKKKI